MGFSSSWMSVAGLDRAAFLDRLGMVETDRTIDITRHPFPRGTHGGVATLPNGRELFVSRYSGDPLIDVEAARISAGVSLVTAAMDETVMVCLARSFTDGKLDWEIEHDPDKTLDGVATKGVPPASLQEALATAQRDTDSQGGADYFFDVALDVVGPIAGYRADMDDPAFDGILTLVELRSEAGKRKRKPVGAPERTTNRSGFGRSAFCIVAGLVAWLVAQGLSFWFGRGGEGWIAPFALSMPLVVLYPVVLVRAVAASPRSARLEWVLVVVAALLDLFLALLLTGEDAAKLVDVWRKAAAPVLVWFVLWTTWQVLVLRRLGIVRRASKASRQPPN